VALSALTVVVAPLATAAPASASCQFSDFYETSGTDYFVPAAGPAFKDGKGGTITASVSKASTITVSGSVTAGASVSGIFASAKVEVSASLSKATAVTVGHTYSHAISANKYGHLQYGSWGERVAWKYYYRTEACTIQLQSSGTMIFPTTSVGWRYWETTT
jgi:hypothetical protein